MKKRWGLALLLLVLLSGTVFSQPVRADAVTDTIGIYVGYYGWQESEYLEKVTYHWSELDDWVGGALDTQETIYSYFSGSRTYLVAARGFSIRDLLYYAGIDFGSIASIDFFTKDHDNGAYRSFTKSSLFDTPRYYFPNLAANEETGELYPWDGEDVWDGAVAVEAMLALEDYTEWDTCGVEFEQHYDSALLSPNCRFHLFFGQTAPTEASTSSAAKYCYKILVTFTGVPVISTDETDMSLKIGSEKKLELTVDAEDALLNDYVRENIRWSSSDESVLTVSSDGVITVKSAGEAIVTAEFENSSVSVHVAVGEEEKDGAGGGETDGDGTGNSGANNGEAGSGAYAPDLSQTSSDAVPDEAPKEELLQVEETAVLQEPLPEETETVTISEQRMYVISSELLNKKTGEAESIAPDTQGSMDEDSTQLTVVLTKKEDHILLVLCSGIGAFCVGVWFEIWRFRRLLRKR